MKKPDNIVHNEKEGYNANLLPYATNVGAPAIRADRDWETTLVAYGSKLALKPS